MTATHQGPGVLSLLAVVRSLGKVYTRRQLAADRAAHALRAAMREARRNGASVVEIADAAGTSRKAVYNAARRVPPMT